MKKFITACIDGSNITSAVCDAAVWASKRLGAPIKFLHILEKPKSPSKDDLSGSIGLGCRENLLDQLIALDEARGKIAKEHGKHLLEEAKQHAKRQGIDQVYVEQRHGEVLAELSAHEEETHLFVIGRSGEGHKNKKVAIGSHVENVTRAVHTPILIAVEKFVVPTNYLLAYDGSKTATKAIERISQSELLSNIPGHVLMVGEQNHDNQQSLSKATELLKQGTHEAQQHLIEGNVLSVLDEFQQERNINLKVMGAYGHSRVREFFLGSTTSKMISSSSVPILVLR